MSLARSGDVAIPQRLIMMDERLCVVRRIKVGVLWASVIVDD